MQYGLLTYDDTKDGRFNIGDYIQSLAAKQYLPTVDKYLYRDSLNEKSEEVKLILNGWFTYKPQNWPPDNGIIPLFISFHLNKAYAPALLSNPLAVAYLKTHAPIGCRDHTTVGFLKEKGIEAYYSSCLTTTLDHKYKVPDEQRTNDIYLVDVLFKEDYKSLYRLLPMRKWAHMLNGKYFRRNERENKINQMIPRSILEKAIPITHMYRSEEIKRPDRFEFAEQLLHKYAKAKLVITSRIHCALPCLALGTPVIFVHGGGLYHENELSRLDGIIEHMNLLSPDTTTELKEKYPNLLIPGNFNWDTVRNPTDFNRYTEHLKKTCSTFISDK